MVSAFDYLRQPSSGPPQPIYAVFGDDAYLRREVLGMIARQALGDPVDDLAIARFAGEQATLADVLDELRTLPFLSRSRLAIVEEADPFVSAHRKELEQYAGRPSSSGVLVLSVKSWPSNTKLAKLVETVGLAVDCKSPTARQLPSWLAATAQRRFGCRLDADAAERLVELVGPETGLVASELEKLSVFVGERRHIRREDVAKMVHAGRIENVWKMLDAATTGQAAQALQGLDQLLTAGESPVGLLAAMSASLLKVHQAGQLRLARRDPREACREAGIPPFAVEKTLQQHRHLGPSRVARLPGLLLQADFDLKGASTLAPRVVLEQLLVTLAQPRRD